MLGGLAAVGEREDRNTNEDVRLLEAHGWTVREEGLFRFRSFADAVRALREVEPTTSAMGQARVLVEEYFDAEKVMRRVLERALP